MLCVLNGQIPGLTARGFDHLKRSVFEQSEIILMSFYI